MEVVTVGTVRQNARNWLRRQETATHRHQLSRPAHPTFDRRACVSCDNVESCVKENIVVTKWDKNKNSKNQTENKEANEEDDDDKKTNKFYR